MRVLMLPVLLLCSVAAYAATAVPAAPSVPLRQVTPVVPVAAPHINGYSPIGCIGKGDVLNVVGTGFGATQGVRGVALGGPGIRIPLAVEGWSDTRVRVRLPDEPKIQPGQWYFAALETNDHSHWLGNTDRNFQVCAAAAAPARALTPAAPPSRLIPIGNGAPPAQDTASGGDASGTATSGVPAGGGSLINGALPPPPQLPADSTGNTAADESIEPGELLVVTINLEQAQQVLASAQPLGLAVKRRSVLAGLGLVVTTLRLPPGLAPRDALAQLRGQVPDLWADFNHRLTLQGDAATGSYAPRLLAWPQRHANCGRGFRIGMVDGTVPDRHAALQGAAITRKNFVTHGLQPAPPDHALAVAALLTGSHGTGLTPAATLWVAEVMRQRDGKHVDATVEWLVQGLNWLVLQHVDVMNLSLGGPRNLILEAAIGRVLGAGIPVVAAAGNDGPDAPPVYPAAQEGVIAVTAVDADRHVYRKANRGDYIRFAAPGVDVPVPRMDQEAYVSGTSFAAPLVTAALVAARQAGPARPWPDVIRQLEQAAQDLGAPGRDATFGAGLVQGPAQCGNPG